MTQETTVHFGEDEIIRILRKHLADKGIAVSGFSPTVLVRPKEAIWDKIVIPSGANGDTVGIIFAVKNKE